MAITITHDTITEITDRIRKLYLDDQIPWIIGYSGGKDSTAVLQLVWYALESLSPDERRHKTVHVISTDTLVEQPVVAKWVTRSLGLMRKAATEKGIRIEPHRLTPKITDSYWVNLIGRGYPAPRQTFRWCTSRLKIDPANEFILRITRTHGESVLVLGTRKAESASRAAVMKKYEEKRAREWLSPNGALPNSWVFSPIEELTNDDVWFYLMQYPNPWGLPNKELMAMYRGASADNECPLVLDTSTPSCGQSRFGCWVCTLVTADRSMEAMIQNDEEKEWMTRLLDFRNEIASMDESGKINDMDFRDYRRMDGTIKLHPSRRGTIHGPYTRVRREYLLRRLLEIQHGLRAMQHPDTSDLTIISDDELREIRRIWVLEKHEFCDSVPRIYEAVTGECYPFYEDIEAGVFGYEEWNMLESICGDDYVAMELYSSLLDIEQRMTGNVRRRSVIDALEKAIRRCYYANEDDAFEFQAKRQLDREIPDVSPFVIEDDFEEGGELE